MRALGIALGVVVLLVGFFLAMFGTPVGWIVLFLGLFLLLGTLAGARLKKVEIREKPPHTHGPEDVHRGPNDDPMYR